MGAPVETEAGLEIEAVSASWVLGQMEHAGNARNIVIIDACRNNPFKSAFRAATRGLARMNVPSGSLVAYAAAATVSRASPPKCRLAAERLGFVQADLVVVVGVRLFEGLQPVVNRFLDAKRAVAVAVGGLDSSFVLGAQL